MINIPACGSYFEVVFPSDTIKYLTVRRHFMSIIKGPIKIDINSNHKKVRFQGEMICPKTSTRRNKMSLGWKTFQQLMFILIIPSICIVTLTMKRCRTQTNTNLESALQTPLPLECVPLALLQQEHNMISNEPKENSLVLCWNLVLDNSQRRALLTSTSPVRSLYLSLMTGRAGVSLRVLDRSLKGCSGAGDGGERPISLSPKLWLRLWEPDAKREAQSHLGFFLYQNSNLWWGLNLRYVIIILPFCGC